MNPVNIGPSHKRWKANCGNFTQVLIYDNVEKGKVVAHFTGLRAKLDAAQYLKDNAICAKADNISDMMIPESTVVVDQATG